MNGVPASQQAPPTAEAATAETRLQGNFIISGQRCSCGLRCLGHLGHLTGQEESAFEEFKKLCAKAGYYTPATLDTKASHDDGTLMYAA